MHHGIYAYVLAVAGLLGAGLGVAVESTAEAPVWVLLLVPIGPVVVGYLLTRGKLRKQDEKVQEIHVLVNSRLSQTLDALSEALIENIALKGRLGVPVTDAERLAAATVHEGDVDVEGIGE